MYFMEYLYYQYCGLSAVPWEALPGVPSPIVHYLFLYCPNNFLFIVQDLFCFCFYYTFLCGTANVEKILAPLRNQSVYMLIKIRLISKNICQFSYFFFQEENRMCFLALRDFPMFSAIVTVCWLLLHIFKRSRWLGDVQGQQIILFLTHNFVLLTEECRFVLLRSCNLR